MTDEPVFIYIILAIPDCQTSAIDAIFIVTFLLISLLSGVVTIYSDCLIIRYTLKTVFED